MSRIGRKPIEIPEGVTVSVTEGRVTVNGPRGELSQSVSPAMRIERSDGTLTIERPSDRGEHRSLHGLTRSLIANMVEGVTAAGIRKQRPPEPYKGKGIRYRGEYVRRKVGKRA